MARPRKKLTDKQIKGLEECAEAGCTNEEIAAALDISADTLERRFAGAIKKGKLRGMVSAKRMLFGMMKGKPFEVLPDGRVIPPVMPSLGARIWFGKQYMGEKDRSEVENNNNNTDSYNLRWADEENASDAEKNPASDKIPQPKHSL